MMIKAAYHALAREHSDPVSVSAICAEAGLSTRSFYRHFSSKDDLLLAILTSETDRAADELAVRLGSAESPVAALADWIGFFLSMSSEPRRRRRVNVMASSAITHAAGYAAIMREISARHREPLIHILEEGARDGSFLHTDPRPDAVIIQDVVARVSSRLPSDRTEYDDRIGFDEIATFVTRAIGCTPRVVGNSRQAVPEH
jgi:AcrR family transcriptional regulator